MEERNVPRAPESDRDLGAQPIDAWMTARGLANHVLVAASPVPLTHKQVQRARKGRRLTRSMQMKIAEAWRCSGAGDEGVDALFNYRGH